MSHQSFLSLSNELYVYSQSSVELEEGVLHVKKGENKDEWIFLMQVAQMQQEDEEILSCFFSSGVFRFSDKDVLLKWDPETRSLYAIQQVTLSWKEYLPFRHYINNFLSVLLEYRQYLSPSYTSIYQ